MAFACVHIPEFSVQALMRFEPGLRGRPLALLEGTPPLCRVVAANETALRAGIKIGMGKAQAEQFGSVVQIRRRSIEQEKNAHAALLDLGASFSPRVEDTAPESILLDLNGLESLFGTEEAIAQRLSEGAGALGFEAHVAVASNPDTALHAARGSSMSTVIPPGEEAARLAPLPISVLGASAEALETLNRWGLRTCAALAALPVLGLSERLGAEGVRMHKWARGAVQRSLLLAEPPVSFEEELTLDYEVTELEPLSFLLSRLIQALCARLEARSLAVTALRVRLKLSQRRELVNEDQREILRQPRQTQNDTEKTGEDGWFDKVLSLPVPMRNAKLLLNLLRLQLQNDPPGAPVCGVFLTAEPARPRATQGGFFVPKGPDPEKLELTLARLAHLAGEGRVGWPEILDTHRPDAFRMRRFAPGTTEKQITTKTEKSQFPRHKAAGRLELQKSKSPQKLSQARAQRPQVAQSSFERCLPHRVGRPEPACAGKLQKGVLAAELGARQEMRLAGFRVFRPAVQARVEIREGRPVKVFFRGPGDSFRSGEVVAASGPWRASGEWWTKDAWQQEEWDLEVVFATEAKLQKSRFLFSRPASRKRDDQNQPAASLGMTGSRWAAEESKVLQGTGLYRFAYDPRRDIWLVRGMFD